MIDILLDDSRDIVLDEKGDIVVCEGNLRQFINTRLLWIKNEWRFNPYLGFPWFDEVFVKNPSIENIKARIRDTVLDVDGIDGCTVELLEYNRQERTISFSYTATADGSEVYGEVTLNG